MKTTVKNLFYYLRVALVVFICLFGISIFFINSSFLCNLLVNGLHLKVAPSFTGGEIAADLFDDSEDDSGSGILRYPANAEFTEGSLDLVRYTVHQPVYNAKWQVNADYWQLDLEFKGQANPVRNIMIYIGVPQGNPVLPPLAASQNTLFDNAENLLFDQDKPWNFAVWIFGAEGKVYDAEGTCLCNAEMNFLNNGKTVRVRIPLKDKNLKRLYSAETTYHYVVVGAYSQFDLGGFMPIEKRRSNSRGGTKSAKDFNTLLPKVYDILGDNIQLAGWDANLLTKAAIEPVEVQMKTVKAGKEDFKEFQNEIYKKISELNEERAAKNAAENKSGESAPSEENALSEENAPSQGQYFGYETLDKALAGFETAMKENPSDALAVCHYGSCLAMKGGQSSVVQAVSLVNKAFEYLDKAVEMASTDEEFVEVLMNRASVCKSVPESVFNKATTGAQDFTRLANLQKNTLSQSSPEDEEYDRYVLAYFYLNAAECYKNAGKETESLLMLQEAKKAVQ